MSMDRKNLALPAIMAVATVIVLNAVVGQDGKHPAPIGKNNQQQKIAKSNTSFVKSRLLKRKSRTSPAPAITPRNKPKNLTAGSKPDGISRLLEAAAGKNKKQTAARLLDDKKVRFVQTRLAQLGYAPGPVDGVFGQKTREAIKKFENSRKLPVTGKISRALIDALSKNASFASIKLT